MGRCLSVLGFVWLGLFLLGAAAAHGEPTGSIVGWGSQVVVEPSVLENVAAGLIHSLGLKNDGTIVAWGRNNYGQCNVPSPNAGFVAVAAGSIHSLGLKSDGTIVVWGSNGYGERNVPAPNAGFVAVAAGYSHSLGLKNDGTIVAWGRNNYGQCTVPSPNAGFVAVAAGSSHSLGLKSDGTIVVWGSNGYGERNVPAPNAGFVAVAGGGGHSLGLKSDGTIAAWGRNDYGQCNVPSPNQGFVAVAAGTSHSLGVKADGAMVAWGDNTYGQCNVASPNEGFVAVAAGYNHSLGLKSNGAVVGWGDNAYGQCNVASPNAGFAAVAAGRFHSLGLKRDGTIVAWGWGNYAQCNVPSPNEGFVSIAAGYAYNLGLKSDGTIVAWGENGYGECTVPAPNADFVAVAAGHYHSLGLKSNGKIVAWGRNDYGQCNVPTPNEGFVGAAGGGFHSLGVKSDGKIVAWGNNDYGQCTVPSPNAGFAAVAAGRFHSLGLKRDGTIVAWGSNGNGECDVPSPNAAFVTVASSWHHNLGLRSDGTIVAWGWNGLGQCDVPSPNAGFVAMATGYDHSLGVKRDEAFVFPPLLYAPAANFLILDNVEFAWQPITNAEYYQVALSTTRQMNNPVWTVTTTTNSQAYVPGPEMVPADLYYWSVRVYARGRWSAYAPSRSIKRIFTSAPLGQPVLLKPIGGEGIALPDYFSWIMPGEAKKVLVEFSDVPSFYHTTGSGESALNHMLVPAMTVGTVYYWRLKAVGDGSESEWTSPEPFFVLGSSALPAQPTRVSPLDDETINGNWIPFSWTDVPEATNYVIDISTHPAFPKNSDQTWRAGPVFATAKLVKVLPTNTTLYWRVAGVNSAGEGSSSSTGYFHITNAPVPISSVRIVNPASDAIAAQGGSLLATGLVTGSHTGTVTVQWFLDGGLFSIDDHDMSGIGFETETISVPTTDLGPHTLELRVAGPSTVASPARSFTVVERAYGVPHKLCLIATDPVVETLSHTTISCRVLDSFGRLVENDHGRVVSVSLEGGGALDPTTIGISNGVGIATYTAPSVAGTVTLSAVDGELTGDQIVISVESGGLAVLKARANAYLDRLEHLTWDSYTDNPGAQNPAPFNVLEARNFVNSRQEGDEQRLLRLNLFLRLVDRAYYHNPDKHNTYPGDDEFVYGAQSACDAAARSAGHIAALAAGVLVTAVKWNDIPVVGKGLSWVISEIVEAVETLIVKGVRKVFSEGQMRDAVVLSIHTICDTVKTVANSKNLGDLAGIAGDVFLRSKLGYFLIGPYFVTPVQDVLDDVVETLEDPSWQGGDDTKAILETEAAVQDVRRYTLDAQSEYASTDAVYGHVLMKCFDSVVSIGTQATTPGVKDAFTLLKILTKTPELAIYIATAADCLKLANDSAIKVSITAHRHILPYYEPSVANTSGADASVDDAVEGHVNDIGGEVLPLLEANAAITTILELASGRASDYESLLRSLEYSMFQDDTADVRTVLDSLYVGSSELRDDRSRLFGAIYAAFDQGRLTIPDLSRSLEHIDSCGTSADSLNYELRYFAEMWLSDPGDESTKLAAINNLRNEIAAYENLIGSMNDMVLQLLNTAAVPSLVITNIQFPERVICGSTVIIGGDIENLGAGTGTDISISLMTDDEIAESAGPSELNIESLGPGEKKYFGFEVHILPATMAEDSVYCLPVLIHADGANAVADVRSIVVAIRGETATTIDPDVETPKSFSLAVYPTPFNVAVSMEVVLVGTHTPVSVAIYDVAGKKVKTVYSGNLTPGPHVLSWGGVSDSGEKVSSGVYFCRVVTGKETTTKKLVLLR